MTSTAGEGQQFCHNITLYTMSVTATTVQQKQQLQQQQQQQQLQQQQHGTLV